MADWLFITGSEVSILCSNEQLVYVSDVQHNLCVWRALQFFDPLSTTEFISITAKWLCRRFPVSTNPPINLGDNGRFQMCYRTRHVSFREIPHTYPFSRQIPSRVILNRADRLFSWLRQRTFVMFTTSRVVVKRPAIVCLRKLIK